ncbi:hypothetical protein TrRE_jg3049 [Triparma retinervis]|uniref:Sodefrin-like factor n=1 Tax=Triparma retinervis TaxID=2557542 RepID=A0A9W7KTD5_9STRA|nr:hypothetical protein TrRE_jg3049 [Triparma retinervis]
MKLFSLTLMALPSLTSAFGNFVDDGCVHCNECSEGELSSYFECSDDGSDVSLFRLKTGATDTCKGEYIEQSGHGALCISSSLFATDDQLPIFYVKRFCEAGQPVQYYFEDQFCEQHVSWQEGADPMPTKAQGCFCEPPDTNVFAECGWGCSACLVNGDIDCLSTCANAEAVSAFNCGFCAQYAPSSWSDVDGGPTVLAQTCNYGDGMGAGPEPEPEPEPDAN